MSAPAATLASAAASTSLRPRLQLALDQHDLPAALAAARGAGPVVDIIEAGTVLCLSEGMAAVRALRAAHPDQLLLADIRIAEAGSLLAGLAFDAGADLVSVVAGASLTTVERVCAVAGEAGGQVQIELGETFSPELARRWREAGAEHVIVKRSRDAEAAGHLAWTPEALDRIDSLAAMGFTVTATGGIDVAALPALAGHPVGIVIAGRAITQSADPGRAAFALREAIDRQWPR